jgi:hypothetical protein
MYINRLELYRFMGGVLFFAVFFAWLFLVLTESYANSDVVSQWQALDLYADHHGSAYLPMITR